MHLRWKIVLVVTVAIATVCVLTLLFPGNTAQRQLEQERAQLRKDGFKIELSEFNFTVPPEVKQRVALFATTTRAELNNRSRPGPIRIGRAESLIRVGPSSAVPVWQLDQFKGQGTDDLWPQLRETFLAEQSRLDAACQAAISGPIQFEPIGSPGPNPLLPYLVDLRGMLEAFGTRSLLALHDGDTNSAWTNLLAATALCTAYKPEPIEISHLVRFACVTIGCDLTWAAVQSKVWTDAQLMELQNRWQSPDFWSGLPETAACSRANMAELCRLDRQQAMPGFPLKEALQRPTYAWALLKGHWAQVQYRHKGSYQDEKALLLYFRDRELELRRAVLSHLWTDMRALPGATNAIPFTAKYPSRMAMFMNTRQLSSSFAGRGVTLLGRAAESEARRRVIVTAIALERFHLRHGTYPESLDKLVPDFIPSQPMDFVDGQPLRYRLTQDGHFVLYSIGLDCEDNGGRMKMPRRSGMPIDSSPEFGINQATDLTWPAPASPSQVQHMQQDEQLAEARQIERNYKVQAAEQWRRSDRRQALVDAILKNPSFILKREPSLNGKPLSQLLRNEKAAATNQHSLKQMLVPQQIIASSAPEIAIFELPIKYKALTNIGELALFIDPVADDDSDEGCVAESFESRPADNGNTLLVWNTIFDGPGKHALQIGLTLNEKSDEEIVGTPFSYVVSNLCQFSSASATFNPKYGAAVQARLAESNGTYRMEIKLPSGELVRTFTGSTTNGLIKTHWDLKDEQGVRRTNNAYDTFFQIDLPGSGRSQRLKGP